MSDETPDEIWEEFIGRMNELAGAHLIAIQGVAEMNGMFESGEFMPDNLTEDSTLFFGNSDPNSPDGLAYSHFKIKDLADKFSPDGPIVRDLGQQWLVMVYAEWNDHFRPRFAAAEGVELSDIQDQVFGDLRRIRHDIVHHHGIATEGWTGKTEVLDWFEPGEPIHLMQFHVAIIMEYLGAVIKASEIGTEGEWRQRDEAE
jgi:hypothetical protein